MKQYTKDEMLNSVASEINNMNLNESFTFYTSDIQNIIINAIESHNYDAPFVDYYNDALNVIDSELSRSTYPDALDFSNCKNAWECVLLEANAVLYTAYHDATQEITSDIADCINEVFGIDFDNKSISEIQFGSLGSGHIVHDQEIDLMSSDYSLIVWKHGIEFKVHGIVLHAHFDE